MLHGFVKVCARELEVRRGQELVFGREDGRLRVIILIHNLINIKYKLRV